MASALRSVLDHVLRQQIDAPGILVVNQNALANSVKAMILEGFGLGWLPREICRKELADGRLQMIGGPSHVSGLEIRIYRDPGNCKPTLHNLWSRLKAQAAPSG